MTARVKHVAPFTTISPHTKIASINKSTTIKPTLTISKKQRLLRRAIGHVLHRALKLTTANRKATHKPNSKNQQYRAR